VFKRFLVVVSWYSAQIKNKIKIFFIYKEIQKGAVAMSYMTKGTKYLRNSSYLRKPFLIYDFATAPF
jgi:hypothetical protein